MIFWSQSIPITTNTYNFNSYNTDWGICFWGSIGKILGRRCPHLLARNIFIQWRWQLATPQAYKSGILSSCMTLPGTKDDQKPLSFQST